MRTLTLLELIVEWEHIPRYKFLVVWDVVTLASTPARLRERTLKTPYYYQRGCCGEAAYNSIVSRMRRSESQFIEVHDTHPQPGYVGMDMTCKTCRKKLINHLSMPQVNAIVDDALAEVAFDTGT